MLMDLKFAFQELAEAVKRIINDRIQRYGYNERARKNTLEGSELQKNMKVTPIEYGIELQIADYWEFIARGWARTNRYPGTFKQFVKNVNEWVTNKNITIGELTQSEIVYYVIKKIWEQGIKARPFLVWNEDGDLTKMLPELEVYIDKWFDDLFEAITEDLDKYFNS